MLSQKTLVVLQSGDNKTRRIIGCTSALILENTTIHIVQVTIIPVGQITIPVVQVTI